MKVPTTLIVLPLSLVLAYTASAVPLFHWGGTTDVSTPVSLPAPGETYGEVDLSWSDWTCVGTLSVSARTEDGSKSATWLSAFAVVGKDFSSPAFVRLMFPPPIVQIAPTWAYPSPSNWRIWFELSPGAYGAMYAVHLKVHAPSGETVRWSADLDGTCARW